MMAASLVEDDFLKMVRWWWWFVREREKKNYLVYNLFNFNFLLERVFFLKVRRLKLFIAPITAPTLF